MVPGDLRVWSPSVATQRPIDAHSTQSGDFTEARQVGGRQVFLTAAGATAFDQLARQVSQLNVSNATAGKVELRAAEDPGWLTRTLGFFGIKLTDTPLGDEVGKGTPAKGGVVTANPTKGAPAKGQPTKK